MIPPLPHPYGGLGHLGSFANGVASRRGAEMYIAVHGDLLRLVAVDSHGADVGAMR